MNAHTPGPWSLEGDGSQWVTARDSLTGLHWYVAEVVSDIDTGNGDEQEANARLIAAAPELLSMAQEFAISCGECGGTGTPEFGDSAGQSCPDCADVRAVIAKATGEQA